MSLGAPGPASLTPASCTEGQAKPSQDVSFQSPVLWLRQSANLSHTGKRLVATDPLPLCASTKKQPALSTLRPAPGERDGRLLKGWQPAGVRTCTCFPSRAPMGLRRQEGETRAAQVANMRSPSRVTSTV